MIKIKLKLCAGCNQPKHIWKNVDGRKYCKSCYGKLGTGVAKKPKPTAARIPIYSSKRGKLEALYKVARVKFLMDYPMCHAHIDARCAKLSSEVHHKCGRVGDLFLDQLYWLPVCHNCHCWIEKNVDLAKEMGLSNDRLTKTEQT